MSSGDLFVWGVIVLVVAVLVCREIDLRRRR